MGVHEGHRVRLKQRAEREGLDGFQPHEALELVLFHALARRDVNPLAHALVERFGSFGGALRAGEAALADVPGVGARAAGLLAFLPDFLELYRAGQAEDQPVIRTLRAAREYCRGLIPEGGDGRLWLMHLGAGGGLIRTESLPAPDGAPRPREVVERALKSRAQALVLAASRADAAPRPADRALAGTLSELLAMIGVTLIDSLLLGGGGAVSLRREGVLAAPLREPSAGLRLMEDRWLWEDGVEPPSD